VTTTDSTAEVTVVSQPVGAARRLGHAKVTMVIVLALLSMLLATVLLQALVWTASIGPLLSDSRGQDIVQAIVFFAWSAVGSLVVTRRPTNRVGLILLIAGLAGQTWMLAAYYAALGLVANPGSLPAAVAAAWLSSWLPFAAALAFTFLFLLFPDGSLPSRRWRPVAWFVGGALLFGALIWATEPGPLHGEFVGVDNPAGIGFVNQFLVELGWSSLLLTALLSVFAPLVRLRRSTGVERQQLKWFTYAGATVALTWVSGTIGYDVGPPFTSIVALAYPVGTFAILLAVSIAIFKHNLYDIDVVISRTIVVGALAVLVTGGYVAVVVGVGTAIGRAGETGLGLSVLATALVAVAFQPARSRVQRLANRLVYGKRATPYEILTVLARRMGDVYAAEDLLPHLARTLAEGTGATRVEVWLRADRQQHRVAAWPPTTQRPAELVLEDDAPTVPGASEVAVVRHQGVLVGALAVTLPPGQELSRVERRLLADLATQVGVALDNLRLVEELKASRTRIVTAQDEERRRIERDIHDGVQQRLVSLTLALRMAAGRLRSAAHDQVAGAVDDAAGEARAALDELRRLARGIHPAIVSEGGLVAALESLAERSSIPTEIVGVSVERLPAPVEVTVYYLVAEALANAAKYAQATAVQVRLERPDGRIRVMVADNGTGGAAPGTGSGLAGLADRVAALDGTLELHSPRGQGTRLLAEIPCASS
jgi:signal transduction histidine kinase